MYKYEEHKESIFTENGQEMFLKIRDNVKKHLDDSGAFMLGKAIQNVTGLNWTMLACVDRLVELGEIREVTEPESCAGQSRVFIKS